jgi:hypothetical protein
MQIQDSQSMIQHIGNGGSLMLDKQGQLETQSAVGRFFQKIGDVFRSITSSGRAAIETRNANLNTAMANMLRRDTLVNPAQGEIFSPMTKTQRNALVMRFTVARAARDFPPEARAAAQTLGLELLRLQGLPEHGNPAETHGKALEVMNKIRDNEMVCKVLRCCDYARTHEELRPQLGEMSDHMRDSFRRDKDSLIKPNGMHPSYLLDAVRHSVRTINGQPPNYADFENDFLKLIPDPKFSGFLSMIASQAGLEAALSLQLLQSGKTPDNPDMPSLAEMVDKGILMEFPEHRYDITVDGDKARVRLEIDAIFMARMDDVTRVLGIDSHASPSNDNRPLGGGRYTFEMVVDLKQDMEGKDVPDFELVNASREPITIRPAVSIPPPPA